jgi:hypothetical protein
MRVARIREWPKQEESEFGGDPRRHRAIWTR